MAKSLDDILNPVAEETVDPAPVVEPEAVSAPEVVDADQSPEPAAELKVEPEPAPADEPKSEKAVVVEPVAEPDTPAQDASEDFVPHKIYLHKPALVYSSPSGTKRAGCASGHVKVLEPANNGMTKIEYTIIACGQKQVRRGYIHI